MIRLIVIVCRHLTTNTTTAQLAALKHPLYRRFWLGSLASVGATQLVILAQGWLVFELTGSPLDLGILGVAASVPTIIVSLFGGVLADRLDKRLVIGVSSLIVALLLLLLAILDYLEIVTVWQVFLITGLISLVSGFDWPARQAIFPSLIEREQMMSAVALNSMLWQGTRMLMPGLGGLLLIVTDTSFLFLLSAIGYVVMIAVLMVLPTTPARHSGVSSLTHFIEGLRFIATQRLFAVLIPVTWMMMFFGFSILQLMPAFAELLGSGGEGYGLLLSASGAGSIIGTLLVGGLQRSPRLGWIMLAALFMMTMMLYAFSLLTGLFVDGANAFYLALLLITLIALFCSAFLIISMTVLQLQVPDELRGRVMAIHGITFSLIALGGIFSGGIATLLNSLPAAIAVGATIILLAVFWMAFTQAEIRQLDGSTDT